MTTVIGAGLQTDEGMAETRRPHSTPVLKSTSARRPRLSLTWAGLAEAQAGRAILWLPFAVMIGAAGYFAWPGEPAHWIGPGLGSVAALACWILAAAPSAAPDDRRRRLCLLGAAAMAGLAAAAIGFTAAQARTDALRGPRIAALADPVGVEGWVVEASMGASRPRLKILVRSIEGVERLPRYVQISTTDAGAIQPGRAVRCFAILRPPDGPLAPGAYDAAFNAYFARVGATGFSYGACRPGLFGPPADRFDAFSLTIAALRRAVTETIADAAPGKGGAVAAALVTGDLSLIDPETTLAFRNSGIGHMLSVSGLHMGLVSGIVYAGLHLMLALISPLALRYPVRKWAAAGAILATGFYLVLSGASVPAQRSFVLIAVALGAILVDRPAITMRGLAVAALIVTLLSPEAVVTPGFQMSFAASAALVAAFEDHARRRSILPVAAPGLLIGALQRGWDWLFGALLASSVAGLASDPFALMHFQRMTLYALPTNLVATPITSLLIAPAAIAGALLSPFGWAEPAWKAMGGALDFLIAAAKVFADRPEAVTYLPRPPDLAFALCVFAITWGCLWRGAVRWAALAPFAAGIVVYALAPRPMLWIDGAGQAIIARTLGETGENWTALSRSGAAFERERLGQLAGLGPVQVAGLAEPEDCSEALCRWRTPSQRTALLVRAAGGWDQACVPDAIVIAQTPAPREWRETCRPAALIEPADLSRRGGAAITESAGAVDVRFAQGAALRTWASPLQPR
ncbi:MAG TPA: ComEC/Rec2 family competence protein [Caulobacterales bacterium]|nr:ComEC/Rec2 family competence protein [Caulobacterales bacterium]